MSDHGEPRFDIQMRCMCVPFSTTRSQTCTSGFKVSVTVLQLGNRPYILIFFPHKHTYKIVLRKHLETLLLFTHMATSIHEHNHITAQTLQVYVSVRTYLMSSLSFLFSLPLFLTMSLTIIFSGRKQPCILHLLLFLMKQQHCLYPVCHRPLPQIISSPQFLLCPTFWCAAMRAPCMSSSLFQR